MKASSTPVVCGFALASLLRDGRCASNQCAVVDWPPSLRRAPLGWRVAQDHLHETSSLRPRSARLRGDSHGGRNIGEAQPEPRALAAGVEGVQSPAWMKLAQ